MRNRAPVVSRRRAAPGSGDLHDDESRASECALTIAFSRSWSQDRQNISSPARKAGARPKSTALPAAIRNVNARLRPSIRIASGGGTPSPTRAQNVLRRTTPPPAISAPRAACQGKHERLSVASWRISRFRSAPIASRTPISRARAGAAEHEVGDVATRSRAARASGHPTGQPAMVDRDCHRRGFAIR